MDTPQLAQIEQRTYRTFVDDGLIDIFVGIFLLNLGFIRDTNFDFMTVVVVATSYLLWKILRHVLIEPRIGYVQLHSHRKSKLLRGRQLVVRSFFLVLLAMVGILWIFDGSWRTSFGDLRPIVGGFCYGIPLAVGGILFEMRRLLGYSAILIVFGFFEYGFDLPMSTSMFVPGGFVILIGLILLVTFLRRYPTKSDVDVVQHDV